MQSKPLQILLLSGLFIFMAIILTACSAPDPAQGSQGNFIGGLFAPMTFLPTLIRGLYDPEALTWGENWDATWGQGSTGYRAGMVIGIIIFIYLLWEILRAVFFPAAKPVKKS